MDPDRLERAAERNDAAANRLLEGAATVKAAFSSMEAKLAELNPDRWEGQAWNAFQVAWDSADGRKSGYVTRLEDAAGQLRGAAACLRQRADEERRRLAEEQRRE